MGFFQNFFDKFSGQQEPIESRLPGAEIPWETPESEPETCLASSFDLLDEETVDSHLRISRYSDFHLTGAVRPSYDLQVIPREAYRHDTFRDNKAGCKIPVLMISASAEKLFDLFLDLLNPLGDQVDVVLESSHAGCGSTGANARREQIDLPVLKSILCEYEQTLMDDGCLGIAVLNPAIPLEVQFDEHKLLIVYGESLERFETVLQQYGIKQDQQVQFITEGEHVHASQEEYADRFELLRNHLGIEQSLDIYQ
ncbi:MAG: hypothetical protein P8M53_07950 [Pirellulales bacterium]|nr:hypothetical protein [Pirellulales bacterium]